MRSIIVVVVCILSYCHAVPINGSERVVINNKVETIQVATTETSNSSKNGGNKSVQLFPPGPPISPSTTSGPTSSVKPTSTTDKPVTTDHTTSIITTTPSVKPSPTSPTTNAPTSSSSEPTSTTVEPPTSSPSTTSILPPTSRPSTQPIVSTTPVAPTNRGFDGPSFIGGIVLAAGLMAIGFVAFKFYKARTELNYHTL